MEGEISPQLVFDGSLRTIRFSIASSEEICTYSINNCPVSHPSQLANPFLGLPLESGKCESCGTAEQEKCEGHFGYIQLPTPVYHPSHINELKNILSLVCLKCMRIKKGKVRNRQAKEVVSNTSCLYCRTCITRGDHEVKIGTILDSLISSQSKDTFASSLASKESFCSFLAQDNGVCTKVSSFCCQLLPTMDLPPISIKEVRTTDGAFCLELKVLSRGRLPNGFWSFLDKFGFHYGDNFCRTLLPSEAFKILKDIPEETKKRLAVKGYFPQEGLILENLPVPPNCLYVPEISDGKSIYSSDISMSLLKRALSKIELIKRSRSGPPNFESNEVECKDLQTSISHYMHLRGTTKAPQDLKKVVAGTEGEFSAKQWLEKMKTLFISKGSGFSSRSVITGDAYQRINEIGIPGEIAKRITFEERVTDHNINHLQEMVDNRLCLTYKDGPRKYAISVGSKGHTNLKVGQIVNRQIMDGDIVFINRPPSTHKHSLQAFSVYIHDDHTVKINPLVCAPLGADFDGDCIHLFYPQSLAAKAEVIELFNVEKQLLSSHNKYLNLQFANDSLLALKLAFRTIFLNRAAAQQLSMFVCPILLQPALLKARSSGPFWTMSQILQSALPGYVDCLGERHMIRRSEILKFDFNRDALPLMLSEIVTSILVTNGPKEAICFFNLLQPLLMELLFLEGFSVSLRDFSVPKDMMEDLQNSVDEIVQVLNQLRLTYNELIDLQIDDHLKNIKRPLVTFILKLSAMGNLIDTKSDSAITKVVQQLGFLGLQLFDRGKLYSKALVEEIFSHYVSKYSNAGIEAYGLVKNSFFHGLNAFEGLIHSISCREIIVRSSRGLTEPGTLFKNLMAILRDVVICYDGTVRNVCSNSIVQFEYGFSGDGNLLSEPPPGEPVGVLAATAISNPAYKAVLDSSQATNSSWELMKEILLSRVSFKNAVADRRVILYLNECYCGKKFCKENAAFAVQNCLRRITLRECTMEFSIEYQRQISFRDSSETTSGLVGHIHLDKMQLQVLNKSTNEILTKCQEVIFGHCKKKGHLSHFFRKILLSISECCSSQQQQHGLSFQYPCLQFSYSDESAGRDTESLERAIHVMANVMCPILLDTIVKGDPRVHVANIIWVEPGSNSWVKNSCNTLKGEIALEVVIEKNAVRGYGDAWQTVLDACLPVIHLVDTSRSIPYGIQQIQELLGISCAFDQSVQRLSTSIRSVAKAVLKEHLILVANSMTCTGHLVGFNTAGFRALFRSLKVQVPFTEATLYTPMKCFERAAEKCHTDSLASAVSSCSWGKHVAVGTGTVFQIIWDKQQKADKDVEKDIYDFLEMVRVTSGEGEVSDAYPGTDVDDLEEENENDGVCLSPETNIPSGAAIFDDGFEVECKFRNKENLENGEAVKSGWHNVSTSKVRFDSSQAWGQSENSTLPVHKPGVWSSWEAAGQVQQQPIEFSKSAMLPGECHSWDNVKAQKIPQDNVKDDWEKWKQEELGNNMSNASKSNRRDCWNEAVTDATEDPEKPPIWHVNTASKLKNQSVNCASFSKSDVWGHESSNTVDAIKVLGDGSSTRPEKDGQTTTEVQDGWSQHRDKTFEGPSNINRWNDNRVNDHKSQGWRSQGWGSSNSADHRNQKNHSTRSPVIDDRKGWNVNKTFTSTGRQSEFFTTEEEKILIDVEPVMRNIRKILHYSSDGSRLSPEDQSFITENVFKHHPDKQAKVADKIDYIMVGRHESFTESRCFYIVSCDGSSVDFSYLKCMENFVKENYPENADSFNKKYFRRRRSAPRSDNPQQQ